jgi:uncharacterized protein YidB (DUF937 family)
MSFRGSLREEGRRKQVESLSGRIRSSGAGENAATWIGESGRCRQWR